MNRKSSFISKQKKKKYSNGWKRWMNSIRVMLDFWLMLRKMFVEMDGSLEGSVYSNKRVVSANRPVPISKSGTGENTVSSGGMADIWCNTFHGTG